MEEPLRMNNGRWIRLRRPVAVLFLLAALGLGGVAGSRIAGGRNSQGVNLALSAPGASVPNDVAFATGFTPVVERVLPAVVNIASTKIVRFTDSGPTSPFFFDPFFREFFGDEPSPRYNRPREQREQSLGSGVFINPDGYLLTNNHVVEGSSEIRISLADKREMKAKVVGTDPRTDIAVLKVEEKKLPVLAIGDSTRVKAGQFVLAFGNPFGLGQTVTMGIVSATGRGNLSIVDYEDSIYEHPEFSPVDRLRYLMEEHALTQAELDRRADVAVTSLSDILNGKRRISPRVRAKFAECFGISASTFL